MPEWTTTGAPIQMWSAPTTTSTFTICTATTPLTYNGSTITTTIPDFVTEYEVKEYCDKVDKHVDQLEEDIEFFNQHRIQQEEEIDRLRTKLDAAETKLAGQEADIAFLKAREVFFTDYTNCLEGRIAALEDKFNEH